MISKTLIGFAAVTALATGFGWAMAPVQAAGSGNFIAALKQPVSEGALLQYAHHSAITCTSVLVYFNRQPKKIKKCTRVYPPHPSS
jgi:hypothetical protein